MSNTRGLAKFNSERRAAGRGGMRTRRPRNTGYRPQVVPSTPVDPLDDVCPVCEQPILDGQEWTRLEGGEIAHLHCIEKGNSDGE
jgi:hypothetical protein